MKTRILLLFVLSNFLKPAAQVSNLFHGYPDIRNGALLVCLHDNTRYLNTLLDKGYPIKAAEVKREQDSLNMAIYRGALQSYKFTKLYFFYLKDTAALRLGKTKGFFLNDKLETDDFIELAEERYLIAEVFEHPPFEHNGTQTTTGPVPILGLRYPDWKLLDEPFPWYVKVHRGFSLLQKSYSEIFMELEDNLKEWYFNPSRRTLKKIEKKAKLTN
jgi:hypothetical protein